MTETSGHLAQQLKQLVKGIALLSCGPLPWLTKPLEDEYAKVRAQLEAAKVGRNLSD